MRILSCAVLLSCLVFPALAAPDPLPSPPPVQAPPPDCVDARNSPDYVPGVDVRGRPVAPADLPGSADVQISTEVYAEVRSANPQLRSVGVNANLPGLVTRPPCPPKVHPQAPARH